MKIFKSRVNYLYSSYFINEIDDLSLLANNLIKNDICSIVYSSDNYVYQKTDNTIIVKPLDFEKIPNEAQGVFSVSDDLSEYQKLYIYESTSYKVNEEHLLSTFYTETFQYIRCFLNKIIAEDDMFRYQLYPMLKIYKSGTIHLSFRTISSERYIATNLEKYITKEVNLYKIKFNSIKIPIQIALKAFMDNNIISQNDIKEYLKTNIQDYSEDNDKFYNLDLNNLYQNQHFNIDFIREYIIDLVQQCIPKNTLGNYWTGKPIVFIEKYYFAKKEKEKLINSVLNRTNSASHIDLHQEKSLRKFNDYEYYSNGSVSLIINNTLKAKEFSNHVFPIIILEEEIINMYLSFKQELERIDSTRSIYDVYKDRKYIMFLKELFFVNSNYGEIKDLINYILYEKMRFGTLELLLKEKIELRSLISNHEFNQVDNSLRNITTLIFSIIGSTSIFEYVIKPLFGLHEKCVFKYILFYIGTTTIMTVIVMIIRKCIKGHIKTSHNSG